MKKLFFLLVCIGLLAGQGVVFAADSADETAAPQQDPRTIDPLAGQYTKGTPANLAKLYWRLNVFDIGDLRAIDNFMMLTECYIYQQNINNDFEWNKIRTAAQKNLLKKQNTYSNRFEFYLPVHLGRYDSARKGFPLVDNTAFERIRRMEVTGNSLHTRLCGKSGEIKDYPRNLMMILDQGFTYNFATVPEDIAQAYLKRKQKEIAALPFDIRQQRYERMGYVRVRVRFHEYQGSVKGQSRGVLAILYGRLEGVDLFEDPHGQRMLSTWSIPNADRPFKRSKYF